MQKNKIKTINKKCTLYYILNFLIKNKNYDNNNSLSVYTHTFAQTEINNNKINLVKGLMGGIRGRWVRENLP